MKRLTTLLAAFLLVASSFAAAIVVPATGSAATVVPAVVAPAATPAPLVKASDIRIPLNNTGKFISLQELADMKVADYEKLSGKKMNWIHRMEFKLAQRKLRHSINEDGTINNRKLAEMAGKRADGETGFHVGGFALGFLLGLIGILIAYLINDDKKSNRVKWAWIGLAAWLVIFLLLII
jgi:hypothetical protein